MSFQSCLEILRETNVEHLVFQRAQNINITVLVHSSPHEILTTYLTGSIEWTPHTLAAAIEHVGIDHCSADIFVTEQLLNSPYVIPVF
jgi:hypothetical protein